MKENMVKIYFYGLIVFTIIYQCYLGNPIESQISFLHVLLSFGTLYVIYQNHPVQKNLVKIWIFLTLLILPAIILFGNLYRIIFGYEGVYRIDSDRWATILIMLVPIVIGIVSLILVSKYLKQKRVELS